MHASFSDATFGRLLVNPEGIIKRIFAVSLEVNVEKNLEK